MDRLILFNYFVVLTCLMSVSARVLDIGPNTTVTSNCGSDGVENANVIVVSDTLFSVTAACYNGNFVLNNTDTGMFYLTVSYGSSSAGSCVFMNEADDGTYHINLIVLRRNSWMQEFRITCTVTTNNDNSSSSPINVIKGTIQEGEGQSILQMTDVLGRVIKTTEVAIQKPVQLTLDVTNIPGAVGVQPNSCDALAGDQLYPILRDGCGVGSAFKADEGFTTAGSVSRSPYFQPSAVGSSTSVAYACNVTFCTTPCDGSTCRTKRKRHSEDALAGEEDNYFVAATDVKIITEAVFRAKPKMKKHSMVSTKDIEVVGQIEEVEPDSDSIITDVETSTQELHTTLSDEALPFDEAIPNGLEQTNDEIVSVESETFSTNLTNVNMTHGDQLPNNSIPDSIREDIVLEDKHNGNSVENRSSSGQPLEDQLPSDFVLIEKESEKTTKGSVIQDRITGSKTSKFAVGVAVVSLFALSFLGLCIAHCRKPRPGS